MTDVLLQSEFKAVAEQLEQKSRAFIDKDYNSLFTAGKVSVGTTRPSTTNFGGATR